MAKDWIDDAIERATAKAIKKHSFPGHAGRPGQEGGSAPRGEGGGGGGGEPKSLPKDGSALSVGNYKFKVNTPLQVWQVTGSSHKGEFVGSAPLSSPDYKQVTLPSGTTFEMRHRVLTTSDGKKFRLSEPKSAFERDRHAEYLDLALTGMHNSGKIKLLGDL